MVWAFLGAGLIVATLLDFWLTDDDDWDGEA